MERPPVATTRGVAADVSLTGGQHEALFGLADGEDLGLELQGHAGPVALGQQDVDDLLGARRRTAGRASSRDSAARAGPPDR